MSRIEYTHPVTKKKIRYDHDTDCDARKARDQIILNLATNISRGPDLDADQYGYLWGVIVEHGPRGDESGELCTCGWDAELNGR